jgi:hypothetical protein
VFLITGISLAFFLGIIACAYAGYLPSPQLPAMNATQATVLGVVEGLTEYLPVSSTGHLIITQHFLGLDQTHAGQKPDDAKKASDAYAICIQAGAILAVLWLYFGRIRRLLGSIVRPDRTNRRLLIGLIIAFIPSAILGLALKDRVIDKYLFGLWPVTVAWLVGGVVILLIAQHRRTIAPDAGNPLEKLTLRGALLIGLLNGYLIGAFLLRVIFPSLSSFLPVPFYPVPPSTGVPAACCTSLWSQFVSAINTASTQSLALLVMFVIAALVLTALIVTLRRRGGAR